MLVCCFPLSLFLFVLALCISYVGVLSFCGTKWIFFAQNVGKWKWGFEMRAFRVIVLLFELLFVCGFGNLVLFLFWVLELWEFGLYVTILFFLRRKVWSLSFCYGVWAFWGICWRHCGYWIWLDSFSFIFLSFLIGFQRWDVFVYV